MQCAPNLLIISNKNKKTVVFVTYTKQKEYLCGKFYSLKLIKDSHPKYVISMDRLYSQTNIDGIKHIHLRDFLKMTTLV